MPTVEIAAIYSKGGKVRKLHQLIVAPDFKAVSEINAWLERIGNLKADGRPILGIDSKELLKLSLDAAPESLYIPAHIRTPWFGMFGSKSGFDSIEEAFEELTPHIRAIETGLSSDPSMNYRVKNLDGLAITSNSDAHSPQKLGREATVVNTELSYKDIIGAYKTNDDHAAKGLEFNCVFLIAAEEGILPYEQPNRKGDLDEERRLFYVAVSRAKCRLDILYTQTRGGAPAELSRFVRNIDAIILPRKRDENMAIQKRRIAKRAAKRNQGSLFDV